MNVDVAVYQIDGRTIRGAHTPRISVDSNVCLHFFHVCVCFFFLVFVGGRLFHFIHLAALVFLFKSVVCPFRMHMSNSTIKCNKWHFLKFIRPQKHLHKSWIVTCVKQWTFVIVSLLRLALLLLLLWPLPLLLLLLSPHKFIRWINKWKKKWKQVKSVAPRHIAFSFCWMIFMLISRVAASKTHIFAHFKSRNSKSSTNSTILPLCQTATIDRHQHHQQHQQKHWKYGQMRMSNKIFV